MPREAYRATTTRKRGLEDRLVLAVEQLMNPTRVRRDDADADEIMVELRASMVGAKRVALTRLFRGYSD